MSATLTDAIRKTVLVDFAPAEAFELFTARIHKWWPTTSHSYGGADVTDVVFEQRQGGRVYEVTTAGERDWARVREWDPPRRLLLDWLIQPGTEVEVTFAQEGPGSRVVLEHRGFGDGEARGNYDSGWDTVLAPFAAAAKG